MSFLTAEWRKLAFANYIIDPELLQKYAPPKTELDYWEGNCYASLVGFMFMKTKLLGIPVPFHRNFEEVNLRFYVRYKENEVWKRGVVFIKEIVPKPAITFIANTVYKEHYATMRMSHEWKFTDKELRISYRWSDKKEDYHFLLTTQSESKSILTGSEEEFITEHYWGYTSADYKTTFEYEVTHPKWECYDVLDYDIKADYGRLYGEEFAVMNTMQPSSVFVAEGSPITIEQKKRI
ncbi:MAG: DUF2071 domain-containing protein [Cyclobacteriaceae bacterium]